MSDKEYRDMIKKRQELAHIKKERRRQRAKERDLHSIKQIGGNNGESIQA